MDLKPLNDILIVELDEDQWIGIEKPQFIEIPKSIEGAYKKKARSGRILSIGSDCKFPHKQGKKIFFLWTDHRPGFKMNGKDVRFVHESEILMEDYD